MSHFTNITLLIKDKRCLIGALTDMGWTPDQIEICDQPTNLHGYLGDQRKDLADIIIRRENVGCGSNDIGFRLEEDGTYTAIISQFDTANRYGTQWVNKLKQAYGVRVAERQAKLRGMTVKKTVKQDGTIQLILMKGKA